jgi:hypothetical protein
VTDDLADLEALVDSSWDREHLAIYADALQAVGDPRGELLAFDLHADVAGPELNPRIRDLEKAFLGDLASELGIRVPHGFVELHVGQHTYGDRWARALVDRLGRYVRRISLANVSPGRARRILKQIAAQPRPWLTRLAIAVHGNGGTIADGALSAALCRATPRLRTLHLSGATMIGFAHPNLRRLRAELGALPSLASRGAAFERLVELELTCTRSELAAAKELLPAVRLPALRRLDLGAVIDEIHIAPLLERLPTLPVLRRLSHLRVPYRGWLRPDAWYDELVARAPGLRELQLQSHQEVEERTIGNARVRGGERLSEDLLGIDTHASWRIERDSLALALHPILHATRLRAPRTRPLPETFWDLKLRLYRTLEDIVDEGPDDGDMQASLSSRYLSELLVYNRDLEDRWRPLLAEPDRVLQVRRWWE